MKKIAIYSILLSAFLLLNATGCLKESVKESDTCHRFIHFTNNSGKDIYYKFRIFDEIGEYNPALAPEMHKIKNNKTIKLPISINNPCYELFAEEGKGKIYFFLFDSEVVENTLWETVRENKLYLKKYVFTIDELNEMKWKIIYSGV